MDSTTIEKAVDLLLEAAPAGSKVILFGSHARGETRGNDSDIDVLVIVATDDWHICDKVYPDSISVDIYPKTDIKLLSDKTVFDNVAFALRILGTRKVELKTRVLETLKLVGLEKRSNEIASMLSGGEQQRVCIARAVVNEPALVLADEPTGNLDLDNANQVMDIFRALNLKGTTVVIATHNREMIEKTGKRTIILDSGNMAGENLPRQGDAL